VPPDANANYAWIQHFIHHLTPNGRAGFVLANGSLTSNTNNENKIREAIVRDDLVDCIVSLPPQLFFTTGIPVCLWFLDRDKRSGKRDRRGEVLFIDARKMGEKISNTQIELTNDETRNITDAYRAWRGESEEAHSDQVGFCRSANLAEIEAANFALTPARYVGAVVVEEDGDVDERLSTAKIEIAAALERNDALAAELKKALQAVDT
jgi:type I restriction enzyme M protein